MSMNKTRINWQAGNRAWLREVSSATFYPVTVLDEVDLHYSTLRRECDPPRLFIVERESGGVFPFVINSDNLLDWEECV